MTRSQLEKMNSEQLVQSFLMLQDEILGNQTGLLQQNNTIDERLKDLSKKIQDLLSENDVIKSRLAVAENTCSILKSNIYKKHRTLPVQTWAIFKTGVHSRYSSRHKNN